MNFMIAAHSDVGIKKSKNQDSLLIKTAQTNQNMVCLCIMCDGMGGLSMGELASAEVVRAFDRWFAHRLPDLMARGFTKEELKLQWDNMILEQNQKLAAYASKRGSRMGTTVTALLLIHNAYYIMNVGDSRAYLLSDRLYQLTKDQTLVQYEVELGHMTWEEAQVHPQRNVLLQCVGASEMVTPDFYEGQIDGECSFLLCSDGFRHVLSPEEIYRQLAPDAAKEEQTMKNHLIYLTELNKERREVDNISAALIRISQEE